MKIHGLNTECTYLFDDTEDFKQPIKILSEDEVQALRESNAALHEFQYYNRRMLEIRYNLSDYHQTIANYSKIISDINDAEMETNLMNDIFVNVNRMLINFITSLKIFVEHLDKRLLKKYGGDSSQHYITFKTKIRNIYDTHFSYRFLITMRDYAMHNNYPLDSFAKDSIRKKRSDEFETELKIEFNTVKLLKNNKVNQKLGTDLRRHNNYFPAKFVMEQIKIPMEQIFETFLRIEKDYFVQHANTSIAFINKNPRSSKTSFGRIIGNQREAKFETVIIPDFIIKQLREKLSNLK